MQQLDYMRYSYIHRTRPKS